MNESHDLKRSYLNKNNSNKELIPIRFFLGDCEPPIFQQKVKLNSIIVPKTQPRRYLDSQKLQLLTQSVKSHGILENLIVRPIEGKKDRFELVAGKRRYQAAVAAGLEEVPVKIWPLTDVQALQISLIENLQREDLNPVEETEAILQLLACRLQISQTEVSSLLYRMQNDILRMNDNVIIQTEAETIEQVFNELGLMNWKSFVSNRLPLLKLPAEILEVVRQGNIAYTKAKVIAKVKDFQLRQELLKQALEQKLSLSQIRTKIKNLQPNYEQLSPQATLASTVSRLKATQLWRKDPKKWKQIQQWLQKIETLLEGV